MGNLLTLKIGINRNPMKVSGQTLNWKAK